MRNLPAWTTTVSAVGALADKVAYSYPVLLGTG